MSEKEEEENNKSEIAALDVRLDTLRRLISNQYSVVHHTERYIFDLAKIASIVVGVISFAGVPQLLFFESENIILDAFVRGIVGAMVLYALVCLIVIIIAVWSVGGINLQLSSTFKPSLWWYSDDRLSKLNPSKPEEQWLRIEPVYEDIKIQISKIATEDTFEQELATLLMLYIRSDVQLRTARRMKKLLTNGLFFALGGFIAGLIV